MLKLYPIRRASASADYTPRFASLVARLGALLALLVACLWVPAARADVGVLLNESLDTSVARITGSGHSAIYFSRICAETAIKLRLCRPDEQGSVMSNYTTLGEDQEYEWNVVPLSIYLYGVEDPQNRPLFSSQKIKHVLEERYRDKFLASYCDSQKCRTSNKAEWREMVGATLERSIYIFVVETSEEQDRALIAEFNSLPNENHFNGFSRNCANFSKRVLNTYFPHSAKQDYFNDFGMTTPKAVARSFNRYGEHHPEAHLRVVHYAQLPGTIKRSTECRSGTEQLYHSKKLLVPMILFADHELPFVAASYLITGRFNPEHELEQHPNSEASDIAKEIQEAKRQDDVSRQEELEAVVKRESAQLVGTSKEWKQYREEFVSLTNEAVTREIIPDRNFLDRLFKYLDKAGTPTVDVQGNLWLDISQGGKPARLGLSASNLFASGTDSQWAYALILARANHYLKSPKHSREIMPDFKNDWAILQSARVNSTTSVLANAVPQPANTRTVALSGGTIQ